MGPTDARDALNFDERDRSRLVLMLVLTLLALPAVWLLTRNDDEPPVAAAPPASTAASDLTGAIGDAPSNYLGPSDAGAAGQPAAPPTVAVGRSEGTAVAAARATYTSNTDIAGWNDCAFNGVEAGMDVVVVNVANGKSVECTIVPSGRDDGLLVLHTEQFARIASLVNAPIHVEVRN